MIDINDFRKLSELLKSRYSYDLNNFAFTIYRRRIYNAWNNLKFKNVDNFIQSISDNDDLFQKFLFEINVNETEMFRDPDVWKNIRESVLPKLYNSSELNIWFPDATSGEELYSLIIVLVELDYYKYSKIFVSNSSILCLDQIKRGIFNKRTYDVNNINYNKSGGVGNDLINYFNVSGNTLKINESLKEKISFVNQDALGVKINNLDLIIFRNKMLYFKNDFKRNVLSHLYSSLKDEGIIICGLNESIDSESIEYKYFDKYNSIYLK